MSSAVCQIKNGGEDGVTSASSEMSRCGVLASRMILDGRKSSVSIDLNSRAGSGRLGMASATGHLHLLHEGHPFEAVTKHPCHFHGVPANQLGRWPEAPLVATERGSVASFGVAWEQV